MKHLLISLLILLSGCTQVITPNFKINTLLKDINIERLVAGDLTIEGYGGESKNVRVITPAVVGESR